MSEFLPISISSDSPERLLYAVTPILTADGIIEGTGFFFQGQTGEYFLITCRHVLVEDNMQFRMRVTDSHDRPTADVETFHISRDTVVCPVDGTDLAAFPINEEELMLHTKNTKKEIFLQTVPQRFNDELIRTFGGFHTTILVGFPHGNFDEYNNLPIWRTGATASHPLVDYRGKKKGLNNIDCFPVDSGAPVFIVIGTYRPRLLGIHCSGLSSSGVGIKSETDEDTEVDLSLGHYIKAELLHGISDGNCWNTYESTKDAYDNDL